MPKSSGSVITFRVSDAERDLIEAIARREGESVSGFVRKSAIDFAQILLDDSQMNNIVHRRTSSKTQAEALARTRLSEVRRSEIRRQLARRLPRLEEKLTARAALEIPVSGEA